MVDGTSVVCVFSGVVVIGDFVVVVIVVFRVVMYDAVVAVDVEEILMVCLTV